MRAARTPSDHRDRSGLAGARAGRGFRFQDVVGALLIAEGIATDPGRSVTPEGDEDLTVQVGPDSIQLQVRSRRGQQSPLDVEWLAGTLSEVWNRQRDRLADENVRVGIVTDREVDGLSHTGLAGVLGDSEPMLLAAFEKLVPLGGEPRSLLARSHLLVVPDPALEGSAFLAPRFSVPEAVAELLLRSLQAVLGEIADERSLGKPARPLTVGDATRVVEDALGLIDLVALESAVSQGICEHVDFRTPIADVSFYLGVDTVPGHVVSGLVFERPHDVDDIIEQLDSHRYSLVAGPSGAGKSALAWLAAYETRQSVRWLRVRRDGDLAQLLRYVDALNPSEHAPVGLVLDDVGRLGPQMWDSLASEARHRPGLLMLGTIREEDLEMLQVAASGGVHRPVLTEALAEEIWRQLTSRNQTAAAGWRESFEASNRLMLEFLHLLTTGDRLPSTIENQIQRRRAERRDDELSVLRLVSVAALHGGTTDLGRLGFALGLADGDMQRVLARLLDEHLLTRMGDAAIGGLHQLRSEAIAESSHKIPPPTRTASAAKAMQTLVVADLASVAGSVLGEDGVDSDAVLAGLARRIEGEPTPAVLAAGLNGIRKGGLNRRALAWAAVLDELAVPAAMRPVTVQLGLLNTPTLDGMDPRVAAAVPRLAALELEDARAEWLAELPSQVVNEVIEAVTTSDEALLLLDACQELGDRAPEGLSQLATWAPHEDLTALSRFIGSATLVAESLGHLVVDEVGGQERLIERARVEFPWVTEATLEGDADPFVRFSYLFLAASGQSAHDDVVALCRLFLGLFPGVSHVAGTALDPSGRAAGFRDLKLAEKDIPRTNAPTPAQVHWHREALRTLAFACPVEMATQRLAAERDVLRRTIDATVDLGCSWVRGDPPAPGWEARLAAISEAANSIPRAWKYPADPTEMSTKPIDAGDVASACHSICSNALPRLLSGADGGIAAFLYQLRSDLISIDATDYWHLLDGYDNEQIRELAEPLGAIRDALCDRITRPSDPPSAMRRASRRAGKGAILATAGIARRRIDDAFVDMLEALQRRLQALAPTTLFRAARADPLAHPWPDDDLFVVVEVARPLDFYGVVEEVTVEIRGTVESTRTILIAPLCVGKVLVDFTLSVGQVDGTLFPHDESAEHWTSVSGLPSFVSTLLFDMSALVNAGLIEVTLRALGRDLLNPEEQALHDALEVIESVGGALAERAKSDGSGVVAEALQILLALLNGPEGAAPLMRAVRGEDAEAAGRLGVVRAELLRWELERS